MKYNFKIMEAAKSFTAVEYNDRKEKKGVAELMHLENFPGTIDPDNTSRQELERVLKEWTGTPDSRVKGIQFHAVISAKGKGNDLNDMKEHALSVMEHLGYGNNPIYIYSHSDTDNDHLHIVTSRIDENGKKINDDFEKKRANKFLAEALKIDSKQNLSDDLASVLQYNFSSDKQFMLLLELKGYDVKLKNGEYHLYKHGTLQESIPKSLIDKNLKSTEEYSPENKKKIQALISKYGKSNDKTLYRDNSKDNKVFRSDLTDKLKKDFGIEFVFFSGKEHDKPYGYMVIDHINKDVYKGSDIYSLKNLSENNQLTKSEIFSPKVQKGSELDQDNVFGITNGALDFITSLIRSVASDDEGSGTSKEKLKPNKKKLNKNQRKL